MDKIVSGMLKPVRQEAGLGNPPMSFTTNASGSVNAVLKRKVNYKKNELHVFINHLKQLVDERDKEVEPAIIGRGKYKFFTEYSHLEIDEREWFKMTRDQRQRHINKVASTQLSSNSICNDFSFSSCSAFQLAVSPELFQSSLKISLAAVQGIWQKAEELLCEPNSISPAPGHGIKSRMVISRSGKRPHLVTCSKQGKYCCDSDCPNWKSMKLCSHSVAVAQLNGSLQEFCDLYRKAKNVPSVSQLAFAGLPGGVGNKETKSAESASDSLKVPVYR